MKMTIDGAIACLSTAQKCKYCKYESENCRKEALDIAVRSMKAQKEAVKEITRLQSKVDGITNKLMVGLCLTIIENDLKEVEE